MLYMNVVLKFDLEKVDTNMPDIQWNHPTVFFQTACRKIHPVAASVADNSWPNDWSLIEQR
jgi:hypothetical protein